MGEGAAATSMLTEEEIAGKEVMTFIFATYCTVKL
jgi:hypothetical protein